MPILAGILQALFGKLFSVTLLPMMIIGLITMTHQVVKARDEKIRQSGEMACMHKHELASLNAQRNVAVAQAEAARKEVQSTSFLISEMKLNVAKAEMDAQELRDKVAAAADDCSLDDGLRERARGRAAGRR